MIILYKYKHKCCILCPLPITAFVTITHSVIDNIKLRRTKRICTGDERTTLLSQSHPRGRLCVSSWS